MWDEDDAINSLSVVESESPESGRLPATDSCYAIEPSRWPADFGVQPSHNRRRRGERGQGLVEFALVAPVFFLLIFAIVDFGLGLKAWITVTQSAREAVRFASVTCATISADSDAVKQRAADTSAGLLTTSDVTVTNCPGGSGASVIVAVTYDYDLVTPLGGLLAFVSGGSIPGTITLTSSTDMRLE